MVKKKTNSTKKLKRRDSWTDEDVQVGTSLPPKISGQLRCFVKVKVPQIIWLIPNAPDITHVRVHWWGEDGKGSVFRPEDGRNQTKIVSRTTARYGIRSGPKQFAEYLNDMGCLVFEVLSGSAMILVGRTQIDHIGSLAPTRPIAGQFPVISADNEKVGELKVTITLEPIMESYDSMSSIPTPDASLDFYGGLANSELPNNRSHSDDASQKSKELYQPISNSGRVTPRGVDTQYFSGLLKNKAAAESQIQTSISSVPPAGNGRTFSKFDLQELHSGEGKEHYDVSDFVVGPMPARQMFDTFHERDPKPAKVTIEPAYASAGKTYQLSEVQEHDTERHKDLIETVLDFGSKLRNAMIISALEPVLPQEQHDLNNFPPNISAFDKAASKVNQSKDALEGSEMSDMESHAVDLVLGPGMTLDQFKTLQSINDGSPALSISDDGDYVPSDLEDPLHDEDILNELFYKSASDDDSDIPYFGDGLKHRQRSRQRSASASSANSLYDAGNQRPASRRSSTSSQERVKEIIPMSPKNKKKLKSNKRRTKKSTKTNSKVKSAEESDSDATNISVHSVGSRVSFDPTPSDSETNHLVDIRQMGQTVDGLSVQRLTLLGRIHIARVFVDHLTLEAATSNDLDVSMSKNKTKVINRVKGKPPTPTNRRKANVTYFVEYQFPVAATSRDKFHPNALATEVVRVVSKKLDGKVVGFNHRSVFPVLFDADSLEKWWKSALVFKVYCKSSSFPTTPKLLGMCSLPLKSVLKADALHLDRIVEVKNRSHDSTSGSISSLSHEADWPVVGLLKVSIELASDSKDFANALAKTQLAEMENAKIVPIPKPEPTIKEKFAQFKQNNKLTKETKSTDDSKLKASWGTQTEPVAMDIKHLPFDQFPEKPSLNSHSTNSSSLSNENTSNATTFESLTLHTLLMVPEGKEINNSATSMTGRDSVTRNLYLVCRMFWCDDMSRSNVCWGTTDPQFNFQQMAPLLLTQVLLERMRNNYMVIEVWDKKSTAQNDPLVGIVKLPLHQLYMSFRDRRVSNALLKSQYPIITVDGEVPIMNPFTNAQHGRLKVVLAMGSAEQIVNLQRVKAGLNFSEVGPERPVHYLERTHLGPDGRIQDFNLPNNSVEHVFEVTVEGIKGLKLLENSIWGEADCFVQYHFPTQQTSANPGGSSMQQATPSLKAFRTATTLCIPDVVLNDSMRHRIVLPEGIPVQREILTACAGVGGGAGGILFEVWFRHYCPNVRDQVVAKAQLPLAKLCAMVTMKKQNEPSCQSFSLTLASLINSKGHDELDQETLMKLSHGGLLDVTVNYKTNVVREGSSLQSSTLTRSLPGPTVCISVGVLKASGLQTAASTLANHDPSMKYPSEVGVNSYVRVKLSFLQKEDERITRTAARTFSPEYSYHMDFPCPLLWSEPGADSLSLAEVLENAEAKFEVWHQIPGTISHELGRQHNMAGNEDVVGRRLIPASGDILLGTVTVPMRQILTHKTGITGWQPIFLPNVSWNGGSDVGWNEGEEAIDCQDGIRCLERIVGGLELVIKFAHHDDLDRVVDVARSVGWAPNFDVEYRDPNLQDEGIGHSQAVTVAIDSVCFPHQNALYVGQVNIDPSAVCYIRYKFYDNNAVCSKSSTLVERNGYVISEVNHAKTTVVDQSPPFSWYLNEERLEVQVWLSRQGAGRDEKRPRNRDKLIGSAYIDLTGLSDTGRQQHRISNIYPLFKPGSSSLGGACLMARISIKPTGVNNYTEHESDENSDFVDVKNTVQTSKSHQQRLQKSEKNPASGDGCDVDRENTFAAHISIERAYHLPMVLENGLGVKPSCYVSYQTADSPDLTRTQIVPNTNDPIWCYERDSFFSRDLLTLVEKNLVFKVWHKSNDANQIPDKSTDKVLGFVSVDLGPLLTKGFRNICGCYNIIDFNGLCQGQIKVSIVPTENIHGIQPCQLESKSTHSNFTPRSSNWCPDHSLESDYISNQFPRINEHVENIKRHHNQLHQHMQQTGLSDPADASRSMLFTSLRNNLKELDEITSNLRQKLEVNPSQDETAPESEAMPLSTSSMLMTYGSTWTGGTTWGLQSAMLKEDKNGQNLSNTATTYVVQSDAEMGASSPGSTEGKMEEMMQQTLEQTGSSGIDGNFNRNISVEIVDVVAADEGDFQTKSGRSDDVSYSASLEHAHSLLGQFNHLVMSSASHIWTHRSNESREMFDDREVRDRDQIDDFEEEEEEDTFANIWAMRSSQRRTSQESLNSTIEPDCESTFITPRVLNMSPRMADGNDGTMENPLQELERVDDERDTTSDTMFEDVPSTFRANEHEHKDGANSGNTLQTSPQVSRIESRTLSPWKAAMQRREHLNQQHDSSSESDNDYASASRPRRYRTSNGSNTSGKRDIPALSSKNPSAESRLLISENRSKPQENSNGQVANEKLDANDESDQQRNVDAHTDEFNTSRAKTKNGSGDEDVEADGLSTQQSDAKSKNVGLSIPNFFLPPMDITKSATDNRMENVDQIHIPDDKIADEGELSSSSSLNRAKQTSATSRITRQSVSSRILASRTIQPPTLEQTQRIAKIFAKKYST